MAGAAGAVLRMADGSTIDLSPSASLRLQNIMPIPIGPGSPVKAQTLVHLSGKLRINASPREKQKRAVLVRGPRKAQLIVAGEALISHKDDAISALNVSGKLLSTTANDWMDVPVLKAVSLTRDDAKPVLRDPLGAPKITGGRWATVAMPSPIEPLTVSWDRVSGAGSYELRILKTGSPAVVRSLPATESQLSLADLGPGLYEVHLSALDPGGLDGAPAAPIKMSVLSLSLPPGGFRTGNASVQIAELQTLSFANTDGVEIAYDNDASYQAAPREFTLRGASTRLLRFRTPGATADASLRVEPRALAAVVEISPKNARWPRDPLQITVQLVNRSGGALPPGVKMIPSVSLGVTPMQLSFSEESPTLLKATLTPQQVTLPNVVRVEVNDQYGIHLGRGFLEIAR